MTDGILETEIALSQENADLRRQLAEAEAKCDGQRCDECDCVPRTQLIDLRRQIAEAKEQLTTVSRDADTGAVRTKLALAYRCNASLREQLRGAGLEIGRLSIRPAEVMETQITDLQAQVEQLKKAALSDDTADLDGASEAMIWWQNRLRSRPSPPQPEEPG